MLFHHYKYRAVRIGQELLDTYDWPVNCRSEEPPPPRKSIQSPPSPRAPHLQLATRGSSARPIPARRRTFSEDTTVMKRTSENRTADASFIKAVLVIEAFGVSDNEVLARAWCAYEGVHALIANVRKTCMSCAIREAYAACITVVILTAGGSPDEKDKGVCV